MVWHFIGIYIINRTLHDRLEIRNFSSRVEKYFTRSLRSLVKYFSTLEEKFRISARPCNILYIWDQGSKAKNGVGSGITGSGSGITSRGIGISSAATGSGIKFSDRKKNMTKFTLIGRKELPPFTNKNVILR